MTNKIRSIEDLIESLKGTGLTGEKSIYRGQVNIHWKVQPLILRQKINNEPYLIEKTLFAPLFNKNTRIPFLTSSDPFEYLMILQHFGVPTRLVDWTKDPLIALFFACYDGKNENTNEDGVFIVTSTNCFETINLRNEDTEFSVKDFGNIDMRKFFERIEHCDIKYIEPLFMNPRQRSQNGCFLFFPFQPIKESDTNYLTLEDYFGHKKILFGDSINMAKKPIDKNFKKHILNELESNFSITYESLMTNSQLSCQMDVSLSTLYQTIKEDLPRISEIFKKHKKPY